MRLNKYISHHTKYSRREADRLIEEGEVKLNRKVIREFGYEVQEGDQVSVKGRPVKPSSELTVIVYNKPKGVLVTKKDDRGRATIYHKLPGKFRHFVPVGRLDYASEGLLILTDNIEVATALMESDLDRAEGKSFTKLRVTITEGKNRELRRFFGHFDAKVLDLKRVAYGGIELNNLPTNKTRFFTRREYDDLHKFIKQLKAEKKAEAKNRLNAIKQEEANLKAKKKKKD
ncbi:MAG: pseudouridine synthase [Epsilonproteobacteria bacterium 4484_20]|nr:MAG: pseudouridine synthase [Epsilonproteobacteria bacterium 4484_20]